MKIDTGLGAELASVADRVAAAEAAGLDCVWVAETTNDPFLSLALAAEHSASVSLGTGVAINVISPEEAAETLKVSALAL